MEGIQYFMVRPRKSSSYAIIIASVWEYYVFDHYGVS